MSLSSSTRPPASNARTAGRPAGAANRLPNSRERRPALAALAVILILLGAAGSALIAVNSGNREGYVAIGVTELPPGHKIAEKDLARGDLAGQTDALVKWSERTKIIGHYTKGWLYEDQYISTNNLAETDPIPSGGAQIGVVLDAGRAPSDGLAVDDIVQVVRVPSANQDSVGPAILVAAAVITDSKGAVVATDKTSTVNTLNVTILVPAGKATAVAAAAASKTLVLVKLNPATKPDVARTSGGG